ncbi:TonB-dependent receptor plug domain-containing protein [Novosphingobium sp.]|uniref:TonB-dependent receptor n=1 Tax=Novosphingobium sp. TaxID=1874826 RepID=UPI0033425FCF
MTITDRVGFSGQQATAGRRNALVAALLGGAVLWTGAVPQVAMAAESAAAAAVEQPGTPEIIVTANRREERAQDVPISLTAISAASIAERGVTQLQDLQASVPSLVIAPNGQASRDVQSPSIRGQSASFQGAPAVVMYFNEVPLPAGYTLSSQGGPGNFVDLQNLQVLEGAQGTLFGRNTTGGAILLTPAKPSNKFEGHVQGGFGSHGLVESEAVINLPVNDKIRLRLVGASRDRDGFTHDVVWNKDRDDQHWRTGRIGLWLNPFEGVTNYTLGYYTESHSNGTGVIGAAVNLTYLQGLATRPITFPVPNGEGGTVNVTYPLGALDPSYNFCGAGTGVPNCSIYTNAVAKQQALGVRATAHDVDDFTKLYTGGITNTTEIELNTSLKLRNIVSWSEVKQYYGQSTSGLNVPLYDTGTTVESRTAPKDWYKQFTEELQLQGSALDKKLTYAVGGFYFNQTPGGTMQSWAINVCAGATPAACPLGTSQFAVSNKSKALYGQFTLDLGALAPALSRLRLTGGYRYTWDTVSGSAASYSYAPLPGGGQYPIRCSWKGGPRPTNPLTDCQFGATLNTSAPNWTIGLDYRPDRNVMVYGKVTRGYKAGGFNSYAVFENTRTFGPESVTDYEAGFKSNYTIAGAPTVFNVNGFYMDYSHIQRAAGDYNLATGGNGAITLNNASAVIKGVEVEWMVRPSRYFEFGGNYSHLESHYKSFKFNSNSGVWDCTATSITSPKAFAGADMSCRPLQYLSPNILSVYGRVTLPVPEKVGKVSVYGSYAWSDAQETAPFSTERFADGTLNEPGVHLPSYGLLSATIEWKNFLQMPLDISVFGTNLADKTYRISNTGVYQTIGAQGVIYGEPRMFGVRLKYNFGG